MANAILTQEHQEVHSQSNESQEDDGMEDMSTEGILLQVDAANGFNSLSRLSALWTVRHRCPKLSRLAFNCYRHQARLV